MDLNITAVIIALSVTVLLLAIGVSLVIGYLLRAYIHDVTPQYTHPEMFDENGNPIADELIAFRFENGKPELDDLED
jgi:hypothetical protein|tara:strand:+ start:877 stop:1107 length:231 start_codon:yes stop_codon:yes gene_type:complete